MAAAESEYEKSVRIKGYGFQQYEYDDFEKRLTNNPNFRLDEAKKREAEKIVSSKDCKITVHPIVIESLEDYIKEITKLKSDFFNPILYRGHTNANYLMLPSVMRNLMDKEDLLYEEFCRRFPNEIHHCENSMEKLVFMQHYKTVTRTLDLSENPLFGLFFACADDKRFRLNTTGNRYKWGEVILVRAPEDEWNKETHYRSDIRYPHNSLVSVLSNVGFLRKEFSLHQLQMAYQNDQHIASRNNFIYFRDVLSRSVIVRTKQDNPRIQHQQGAFLLVNANEIDRISCLNDYKNVNIDIKKLTDYVLSGEIDSFEMNLEYMQNGYYKDFPQLSREKQYDVHFKKVVPYSLDNNDPRMQNDPFDLRRFLYKNENGEQIVFLIPPTAKSHIKEQLAKLNITDAFVYPEMDSVSNELYERFSGSFTY